jgi:hypothetical protein
MAMVMKEQEDEGKARRKMDSPRREAPVEKDDAPVEEEPLFLPIAAAKGGEDPAPPTSTRASLDTDGSTSRGGREAGGQGKWRAAGGQWRGWGRAGRLAGRWLGEAAGRGGGGWEAAGRGGWEGAVARRWLGGRLGGGVGVVRGGGGERGGGGWRGRRWLVGRERRDERGDGWEIEGKISPRRPVMPPGK